MEKALSPDEKIRRAEEIYYKRKMQQENRSYARVPIEDRKKDITLFKRMLFQILVCAVIYTAFYMIKNTEYIFSESVINKTKEILSYDINIPQIYSGIKEYLNSFTYKNIEEQQDEIQEESNLPEENKEILEESPKETTENIEGIGGENIEEFKEEQVALSQMEKDAKYIKETITIALPLRGVITSKFGIRESNNPIVSKNHTGIDIAAGEGTVFVAAMSGIVEEVSNVRRTRKSCKNYKWRCCNRICTLQNDLCLQRTEN